MRLPKEFRLPGHEARVSREGHRVILEPIARDPAQVSSVFADIDEILAGNSFPEAQASDRAPLSPDRRDFFPE